MARHNRLAFSYSPSAPSVANLSLDHPSHPSHHHHHYRCHPHPIFSHHLHNSSHSSSRPYLSFTVRLVHPTGIYPWTSDGAARPHSSSFSSSFLPSHRIQPYVNRTDRASRGRTVIKTETASTTTTTFRMAAKDTVSQQGQEEEEEEEEEEDRGRRRRGRNQAQVDVQPQARFDDPETEEDFDDDDNDDDNDDNDDDDDDDDDDGDENGTYRGSRTSSSSGQNRRPFIFEKPAKIGDAKEVEVPDPNFDWFSNMPYLTKSEGRKRHVKKRDEEKRKKLEAKLKTQKGGKKKELSVEERKERLKNALRTEADWTISPDTQKALQPGKTPSLYLNQQQQDDDNKRKKEKKSHDKAKHKKRDDVSEDFEMLQVSNDDDKPHQEAQNLDNRSPKFIDLDSQTSFADTPSSATDIKEPFQTDVEDELDNSYPKAQQVDIMDDLQDISDDDFRKDFAIETEKPDWLAADPSFAPGKAGSWRDTKASSSKGVNLLSSKSFYEFDDDGDSTWVRPEWAPKTLLDPGEYLEWNKRIPYDLRMTIQKKRLYAYVVRKSGGWAGQVLSTDADVMRDAELMKGRYMSSPNHTCLAIGKQLGERCIRAGIRTVWFRRVKINSSKWYIERIADVLRGMAKTNFDIRFHIGDYMKRHIIGRARRSIVLKYVWQMANEGVKIYGLTKEDFEELKQYAVTAPVVLEPGNDLGNTKYTFRASLYWQLWHLPYGLDIESKMLVPCEVGEGREAFRLLEKNKNTSRLKRQRARGSTSNLDIDEEFLVQRKLEEESLGEFDYSADPLDKNEIKEFEDLSGDEEIQNFRGLEKERVQEDFDDGPEEDEDFNFDMTNVDDDDELKDPHFVHHTGQIEEASDDEYSLPYDENFDDGTLFNTEAMFGVKKGVHKKYYENEGRDSEWNELRDALPRKDSEKSNLNGNSMASGQNGTATKLGVVSGGESDSDINASFSEQDMNSEDEGLGFSDIDSGEGSEEMEQNIMEQRFELRPEDVVRNALDMPDEKVDFSMEDFMDETDKIPGMEQSLASKKSLASNDFSENETSEKDEDKEVADGVNTEDFVDNQLYTEVSSTDERDFRDRHNRYRISASIKILAKVVKRKDTTNLLLKSVEDDAETESLNGAGASKGGESSNKDKISGIENEGAYTEERMEIRYARSVWLTPNPELPQPLFIRTLEECADPVLSYIWRDRDVVQEYNDLLEEAEREYEMFRDEDNLDEEEFMFPPRPMSLEEIVKMKKLERKRAKKIRSLHSKLRKFSKK